MLPSLKKKPPLVMLMMMMMMLSEEALMNRGDVLYVTKKQLGALQKGLFTNGCSRILKTSCGISDLDLHG
jgi:hypothetical protein